MKRYISGLLGAVLSVSTFSVMADDADKLKELERAMATPAEGAQITKKPKTRAIVFDAQPTEAATTAKTGPVNCSVISPDAKLTAIDFTIEFKVGSADIAPPSEKLLREISKVLSLSDKCVVVEGHTDASGNADRNLLLSRDRANSVVNFISDKAGLNKSRLVPMGKGSSEPLKNLDPRSSHNRRVVFKVVG